jgi:hypothetical protein
MFNTHTHTEKMFVSAWVLGCFVMSYSSFYFGGRMNNMHIPRLMYEYTPTRRRDVG